MKKTNTIRIKGILYDVKFVEDCITFNEAKQRQVNGWRLLTFAEFENIRDQYSVCGQGEFGICERRVTFPRNGRKATYIWTSDECGGNAKVFIVSSYSSTAHEESKDFKNCAMFIRQQGNSGQPDKETANQNKTKQNNMKNISKTTLFVNINGNNGREVREARIVELNERPCYYYFNKSTRKLDYIRGCGFGFMLEIAGIGKVSSSSLLSDYNGGLYKTINLALENDENYSLFIHGYNEHILNIGSIADIYYGDFNLTHPCTTLEFEDAYINRCCVRPTHFHLKPISYYWDGTKSKRYEIVWKFKFNLINNEVVMYKGGSCDYEDKLGKLYATREMCENANKPAIVKFSDIENKKENEDKEITFKVTAKKSNLMKLKGMGLKIDII